MCRILPTVSLVLVCASGKSSAATLVDRTAEAEIVFRHHANPTPTKYLIETMGAGVAVLDFDSDGWLDILFINSGAITQDAQKLRIDRSAATLGNRLFRNDRNGHFTDVTPHSGLAQQDVEIYGMGATTADYDNDGDTDVLITGYGRVQLFENRDNGQFRNVTTESTIAVPGWSTSAGFADLDNDGLLDLVVTRYLDWNFEKLISCGGDIPEISPMG